jgi:hypothetical protein
LFEGSGAAPLEHPSKRDLGCLAGWGESADGANKGSFVQGYNAQIAVDDEAQILVACDVTQQTNDKKPLVPMAARVVAALGQLPEVTAADAGSFSEAAVEDRSLAYAAARRVFGRTDEPRGSRAAGEVEGSGCAPLDQDPARRSGAVFFARRTPRHALLPPNSWGAGGGASATRLPGGGSTVAADV